jgi:hydrogenase nickel incorporation protein HypA/HybF
VHELGVVIEIVKTVEAFAKEAGVTRIATLVLQIGELSSMVPKYIEDCYPAAVDGSLLEGTELVVEILPGKAVCKGCGKVFNLLEHKRLCPRCGGGDSDIISGKEFLIKEIVAC